MQDKRRNPATPNQSRSGSSNTHTDPRPTAGGQEGNRPSASEQQSAMRAEQREQKEEDAIPDDPDPVLDEQDLKDNNLTVEQADDIEWDPGAQSGEGAQPRH
ncbi:MAG TPA: hypothetical protein VGR89_06850 [Puia sp.]|nr:hypothetical protein [Puia sp.]